LSSMRDWNGYRTGRVIVAWRVKGRTEVASMMEFISKTGLDLWSGHMLGGC
jgi:hypothetical protein